MKLSQSQSGVSEAGTTAAIVVLSVVVVTMAFLWTALVITILWGWFVVPRFHLPSLNVVEAAGLLALLTLVRTPSDAALTSDRSKTLRALVHAFVQPAFALALGWVLVQFV